MHFINGLGNTLDSANRRIKEPPRLYLPNKSKVEEFLK